MSSRKSAVSLMCAALISQPAAAAVSDAEFEQLKAQLGLLVERVNALEAENQSLKAASEITESEVAIAREQLDEVRVDVAKSSDSWAERIRIKGDFRYRYESIDLEDADSRTRNRVRARTEILAQVSDDVVVGIGIATGGEDPVSSNQTLGDGGSTKDLRLDLAYATWQATDELSITAGKYKNPLYRPQKSALLFDGDWRPEGLSASWRGENLFVNFLGNWLESDSRRGNDEFGWGLQAGTRFELGDARLTTALAYYDFPTQGNTPYFDDDFFGNTSIDGVYAFDYQMIEAGADLSLTVWDMPLVFYANYVQNQDADDFDTGYLAGVSIGKASDRGRWELAYQYEDLEADAVLGLLSDSDFAAGGTDGKGHRITGAYGLSSRWKLGFTWFVDNETDDNRLDRGLSYDRLMIDTAFKY